MSDLHAQIMNLPCKAYDGTDAYTHYCRGHRDARHAAAELALAHDARIRQLEAELALIANTDPIDACLDPQRAIRIATAALKEPS